MRASHEVQEGRNSAHPAAIHLVPIQTAPMDGEAPHGPARKRCSMALPGGSAAFQKCPSRMLQPLPYFELELRHNLVFEDVTKCNKRKRRKERAGEKQDLDRERVHGLFWFSFERLLGFFPPLS